MIEGAKHHLHGDALERFVEALRYLLTDVQEDQVKEEGSIELELDPIGGGFPQIGEIEHAFGDQKSVFNTPAPPIQLTNVSRREVRRIKDVGEVTIPLAPPQHGDQAERVTARI